MVPLTALEIFLVPRGLVRMSAHWLTQLVQGRLTLTLTPRAPVEATPSLVMLPALVTILPAVVLVVIVQEMGVVEAFYGILRERQGGEKSPVHISDECHLSYRALFMHCEGKLEKIMFCNERIVCNSETKSLMQRAFPLRYT